MLRSLSRFMMEPYVRSLCLSERDLKGAAIMALESQLYDIIMYWFHFVSGEGSGQYHQCTIFLCIPP